MNPLNKINIHKNLHNYGKLFIITLFCFSFSILSSEVSVLTIFTISLIATFTTHLLLLISKENITTLNTLKWLTICAITLPATLLIFENQIILVCIILIPLYLYLLIKKFKTESKAKTAILEKIKIEHLILAITIFTINTLTKDYYLFKNTSFIDNQPDYFYYNFVTESLSRYSPLTNNFSRFNTPFKFQFASFFLPAVIHKHTQLTSHQSLWCIALPFYKTLFYTLLFFIFQKKLKYGGLIAIGMFLGFYMLNPINIINFKLAGLLYLELGTINVGGVTSNTLSACLMLLLFKDTMKEEKKLYLTSSLILVLISMTKTAYFIPSMIFYGLTNISTIFSNIKEFINYIITSSVIVIIFFFYHYNPSTSAQFAISPLEYVNVFIVKRKLFIFNNFYVGTILGWLLFLAICLGPRFLLLYNSTISKKIFYVNFVTLLISSIPLFLITLTEYDYNGAKVLRILTFDFEQIIKGAFFYIQFSAIYMFINSNKYYPLIIKILIYITTIIGIIGFYFSSQNFKISRNKTFSLWRADVKKHTEKNSVKCILGESEEYPGQLLAGDGIGPFWYSGRTGSGGYHTLDEPFRNQIIDSLMYSTNTTKNINALYNNGVTEIIITPKFFTLKNHKNILNLLSKKSRFVYTIPEHNHKDAIRKS